MILAGKGADAKQMLHQGPFFLAGQKDIRLSARRYGDSSLFCLDSKNKCSFSDVIDRKLFFNKQILTLIKNMFNNC